MPTSDPPSLQRLAAAASAAEIRELEFRKSIAAETARLERARQFAHRRLDLIRTTMRAVLPAKSPEDVAALGNAALKRELGWNTETEPRKKVLAAWQPVLAAVHRDFGLAEAATAPTPTLERALEDFESWYEATFGAPFLAHFDVELPELPVVEF